MTTLPTTAVLTPPDARRVMVLYHDALASAGGAARKAILCGIALHEQKALVGHGAWLDWLAEECPGISDRHARRWMEMADDVCKLCAIKQIAKSDTRGQFAEWGQQLSVMLELPRAEQPALIQSLSDKIDELCDGRSQRQLAWHLEQ